MLNWLLATIATGLWSTAYGWYFTPDLKRWLWRRRHRKRLAEIERANAYAAWMRRPTPSRSRTPPPPPPQTPPAPAAGSPPHPTATVIRFPPRSSRPPRP